MKPTFLYILFILSLFSFSSCSDDDEGSSTSGIENILKASSWVSDPSYDFSIWGNSELNLSLSKATAVIYFLDDGKGLGKIINREIDTYFGSSSSSDIFAFSYYVNGNKVIIDGQTLYLKNDKLCSSEKVVYKKNLALSYGDYEWIKSASYYVLPDKERYNLNIWHGCSEDMTYNENGTKYVSITLGIGVDASEMFYSRGFNSITATYSITGGTFNNSKKTVTLYLPSYDDKGAKTFLSELVTTKSKATIYADFTVYDSKKKEKVNIASAEYTISGNNNNGNNNENDENNDNKSYTGEVNGHEYIDLGLSVKWATMNLGANSPEEYGAYTSFGSSEENGDYCYDYVSEKKEHYGEWHYPVEKSWGSQWQIPTIEQWQELIDNCTYKFINTSTRKGMEFTSKKNNQKLFLPACGQYILQHVLIGDDVKKIDDRGVQGYYWSANYKVAINKWSDYSTYCNFPALFQFTKNNFYNDYGSCIESYYSVYYSRSIRPVTKK